MEWVLIGVLALVAGRFALNMPGINARFSVSDTFFIISALLFGPGPATVTIAWTAWRCHGRRYPFRNLLFNGSGPAIAFWIACQVFFQLAGTGPLFDPPCSPIASCCRWPRGGCVLPAQFRSHGGGRRAGNARVTARSVAASLRGRLAQFFRGGVGGVFPVIAVDYVSLIALAAVIPLFAIFHLAMKSWAGRLEDANRHIVTVDKLYLSTIGALSTAIEAKDGVTSSHIHRVQHYAMGLARALGGLDEQR